MTTMITEARPLSAAPVRDEGAQRSSWDQAAPGGDAMGGASSASAPP